MAEPAVSTRVPGTNSLVGLTRRQALIWKVGLLVFAANAATLILELVAGRMLAPFIGVSLLTWTSIIGVVLAGISLGNWLGGAIADRYPSLRTLGGLFLLGGLSTLATLGIVALLGDGTLMRPVPLLPRALLLTVVVFFPPSLILGMLTPVAIKLALPGVESTGRVVGLMYALSTLGSLVGNFATGFVLVAYLPVNTIVLLVSAALLLLGALAGEWWRKPGTASEGQGAGDKGQGARDGERGTRNEEQVRRQGGWSHLPGNLTLACIVVAIASFWTMAIELSASRMLAPFVGISLYSWTGIIGVVLAGITLGNYLGGRLADRWPRQWVLGLSLFAGGLASLAILLALAIVVPRGVFAELGLIERIVVLTAVVFFVPVLILGTISPQVIKLAVTDLGHAGRVSGRIYAWSTAGAIVGTFATGWALISLLGVNTVVLAAGLAIGLLAIIVGQAWRQVAVLAAAVVVLAGSVYGLHTRQAIASRCTMETNYFCIRVGEAVFNEQPVKTLVLDHLVHSYVKLGDPTFLGYGHEQVQAELARLASARTPNPRILVIGGGGYTFPRWVESQLPAATVEVVEIDPGVTEVVHRDLGMPRDTRIATYNLDGRQFVDELAPRQSYQLIVQDAVNDLSVPYHILTREYNDHVRSLLTGDGVYLLTVIDLYYDGQLLRSTLRTMMQTFPAVQLLGPGPVWSMGGSGVYVVYGANRQLDPEELRQALRSQGIEPMKTVAQPDDQLRAYVAAGPQIILTDQYAPVDNLISSLFRRRY